MAAAMGKNHGGRERLTGHQVSYLPFGMTEADLLASRRHFYRSFYLRSRVIKNYIVRLLEPTARKALIKGLMTFYKAFGNRIQIM
jgi:hypothetical protein